MNHDKHPNPSADPQLVDYIRQNRQARADDASIREALIQAGWATPAVDQAFAQLHHSASHHVPAPPQPGLEAAQNYKLFTAIRDGYQAIKNNIKGVLLVGLINIAISTALFIVTVIVVTIALVIAGIASSGVSAEAGAMVLVFIVVVPLVVVAYLGMGAFMTASLSLAINDGIHHHQSDIRGIITKSCKVVPRVALSQLLASAVLLAPLLILIVVVLFLGSLAGAHDTTTVENLSGGTTDSLMTTVIAMAVFVVPYLIWVILASMALALVQMVAVFEPHIKITKTLRRSWHLMKKGGFWFMAKGILLLTAIELLAVPFMALSPDKDQTGTLTTGDVVGAIGSIIISVLYIPISLLCVATLVVFYRNRQAIRS